MSAIAPLALHDVLGIAVSDPSLLPVVTSDDIQPKVKWRVSLYGLDTAQLAHAPEPDAWSVSDVLHHLALSAETLRHDVSEGAREPASRRPQAPSVAPRRHRTVIAGADDRRAVAPDRV